MESKVLTQITDLIANDQTKEAIGSLQQLLKGNPLLSKVILYSGRYADIKKQIRMGTINDQDADVGKNKIRLALLEMIGELDDKSEQDEKVRAALEIEGSKLNVSQLMAKEDITIKADQQNSEADITDLDSGGKIDIDIKQN